MRIAFPTATILLLALAVFIAACASGPRMRFMRGEQAFQILMTMDGEGEPGDVIIFDGDGTGGRGAEVTGFWDHQKYFDGVDCRGPESVQMLLAFQFAEGKGPEDFRAFKELDKPWVASNGGCNTATVFTERTDEWPYDAFELITFSTVGDFERAYAGNEELAAAGDGLFGPQVLAAVVQTVELRERP
jgi:hypothetical protein